MKERKKVIYLEWRDKYGHCQGVKVGELVCCKDCKHYDAGENESECWTWCEQHEMSVDEDFFCKDGERKEE